MEPSEIYAIMNRWVSAGSIADSERQALKAEYLRQLGITRCTTCPSFWHDLKVHFLLQLRAEGLPRIMATRQYMIKDGDILMLPGGQTVFVNEGVNSESVTVLTDEMAIEILKRYPGYSDILIKDPEYKAAEAKPATAKAATKPAAKPVAKPAVKPALVPTPVKATEPVTPQTEAATADATDAIDAVAGA